MQEREIDRPSKPENLITRINYSGKAKGILGVTAIIGASALAWHPLEQAIAGQFLPTFVPKLLFNLTVGPCSASLSKILHGDDFRGNIRGAIFVSTVFGISESMAGGTSEIGDVTALAIGTVGWAAFEKTAKKLHDSGLTLPIYRALGIQHRKFG